MAWHLKGEEERSGDRVQKRRAVLKPHLVSFVHPARPEAALEKETGMHRRGHSVSSALLLLSFPLDDVLVLLSAGLCSAGYPLGTALPLYIQSMGGA